MNNQKKGKNNLTGFFARKQFRYGGYATVLTAVVIAVVILLNVAISAVEANWALTIDVTAMGATEFDEQTKKVVSEVQEPVKAYTLYKDATSNSLRVQVEEVLNKYRAMNNNIAFENVDPVKNPTFLSQYTDNTNLTEGSIILVNEDGTRVKIIDRADYYYYYTSQYTGQTLTVFDLESKLTAGLMYVTSDETPRVFYLAGHNELDASVYCTVLTQQLQNANYDVATLNMAENKDVTLEAGDTVVVINPLRDLSDAEYETLRKWLAEGGRMLFVLDQETDESVLVNFTKLLDYYQMSFGEGVIMEDSAATSNWNADHYTLVPNMDAEHAATAELAANGAYLTMPNVRPINAVDMPESGLQFTNILTSSANATVVNGEEISLPGTQILAQTMLKANDDPQKEIRIALLGTIYALADTSLLNYSYNMSFTTSVFNWLVNREESTVSVSAKLMANNTLAIPDSATAWTLGAIIVIVIPVLVTIAGIVVWMKRRRL